MSTARKLTENIELAFNEPELDSKSYHFFSKLMYDLSGVNMPETPKNQALMKNRLSKLMRRSKIDGGYPALMEALKNPSSQLMNEFISSLTTNKTHFFREDAHFDWFKEYLKTHFKNNQELRIWCAASSTGQEPYTTAIVLSECLDAGQLMRTKFIATDIDLQVLGKAAAGKYREPEMEGLSDQLKMKYFTKTQIGQEVGWAAKPELTKLVRFAPMNLVQEKYPFQHKFHVIFCRNVLIYFDPPTTKGVINRMAGCLSPGGYLILGHSESGTVKDPSIKPLSRAIYQKL